MKLTLKLLFAFFLLLSCIISCNKEDDSTPPPVEENVPPSKVKNITAEVISGTMILVSWDAATDENEDPVTYDLIVNDINIKEGFTETSVELDAAQFINSNKAAKKISKKKLSEMLHRFATELALGIQIKSYDDKNSFSESVAIRVVEVNRPPAEFEIANIWFDFSDYDEIQLEWSSSSDADNDNIKYDVFLNDNLLAGDYVILPGVEYGYLNTNFDFSAFINDPISIKVIAKDGSGGNTEISETFNFRTTDSELGTLSIPHSNTIDFTIEYTEPEDRIGYTFEISEETGYIFSTSEYVDLVLRDSDKNIILSGGQEINGENLIPGQYYLELVRTYNDDATDLSGVLSFTLRNSVETDVNLGLLTTPYNESFNVDLNSEPDNAISYSFEINEETGFSATASDAALTLRDSNGNEILNSNNNISLETLTPGVYSVEISNPHGYTGSFNLILRNPTDTDINLGVLGIPHNEVYEFTIDNQEPDNAIAYTFEITEETGFAFSTTVINVNLTLKDLNGDALYNGQRVSNETLSPGIYYLLMSSSSEVTGSLNFILKDPKETDVDLGLLSIPHFEEYNLELSLDEPDNSVGYSFEINEETGFSFSTSFSATLQLKDANTDDILFESLFGRIANKTLSPGAYYLEIINSNSDNAYTGILSFTLKDPADSDIDLGVLTIPYNEQFNFEIPVSEPDNIIGYAFEINEQTNFSITSSSYATLRLKNSNDDIMEESSGNISGESLAVGSYYLEVINNSDTASLTVDLNLNFVLGTLNSSDVDLGTVTLPYNDTFNYSIVEEDDGMIKYTFTISETATYDIVIRDADYDTYLYLYDSNDAIINEDDDGGESVPLSGFSASLSPGTYTIGVAGYGTAVGTGSLSISIQ